MLRPRLEDAQHDMQMINQSRFDTQINIDDLKNKMAVLNIDEDSSELKKIKNLKDKDLVNQLKNLMLNKLKYTEKDRINFERLEDYFKAHDEYKADLKDLHSS